MTFDKKLTEIENLNIFTYDKYKKIWQAAQKELLKDMIKHTEEGTVITKEALRNKLLSYN